MAEMIPASLKKSASKGEHRVFRLLATLPDDCTVYYEPRVRGLCPDFILIHPRLGLLILEVKGWQFANIRGANTNDVCIERDGQEAIHAHPLRQAREYMFHALDHVRDSLFADPIVHHEGAYKGRLRFPMGHAVILSNIRHAQLAKKNDAHFITQFEAIFPPRQTVYRDELESLVASGMEVLETRLRGMFTTYFAFPPLTPEQVDVIRGILHPQIVFRKGPVSTPQVSRGTFPPPAIASQRVAAGDGDLSGSGWTGADVAAETEAQEPPVHDALEEWIESEPKGYASRDPSTSDSGAALEAEHPPVHDALGEWIDGEPVGYRLRDPSTPVHATHAECQLYVLDKRQEGHARSIGDGHRLLFGVAGSGKTVILLARARELSMQDPQKEILVLCFNISLAAYLRASLADCPRVTVHHFDGWASSMDVSRRRNESDESFGLRFLTRLSNGLQDTARFDAVLVDEAQDFEPTWFKAILMGMKEPVDGDLLIVGDGHQSIRTTRRIVWKDLGIQAAGRTTSVRFGLDRNYRNSREIIGFANSLLQDASGESHREGGGVEAVPLALSRVVRSTGHAPRLLHAPSRKAQCDAAFEVVTGLLRGHWNGTPLPAPLLPEEIGILYPCIENDADREALGALRGGLGESGIPVHWLTENRESKHRVCEPTLKVQSIHSAKGLQYRAVVLLWADILPRSYVQQSEAEERALLYVALTRAEEFLSVHYTRDTHFLRILAEGQGAPA